MFSLPRALIGEINAFCECDDNIDDTDVVCVGILGIWLYKYWTLMS